MTNPALVSARVVFVDKDGRLTRDGLLVLESLLTSTAGGGPFQPLDADLTAWATVSPAAYLNAAGIAAAYQPLDADLTAWAAVNPAAYLNSAGIAAAYQPLDADLTSWAGVTRAAGFDTFIATPSSANLAAALTDETGSGLAVFGTESTWTPAFATTGVAFTTIGYSAQEGYYEKYGRMVRFFGHLTVNSLTVGAASGNLIITGLPFSNAVFGAPIYIGFITGFTTNTPIHGALAGTTINLYHRTAITGGAVVSTFAVLSATSDIYFGGVYHV